MFSHLRFDITIFYEWLFKKSCSIWIDVDFHNFTNSDILKARSKRIKLLEENIKEYFHDLRIGKDFLNRKKTH